MLELRDIVAGYETGPVLRHVDLVVPDGGVVALLGPNGAGKTTLLRVASGLLPAFSGQLLIDNHNATGMQAFQLAQIGVCHVPEGRGIFPALSVADNLRLQAPRQRERQAQREAIAMFPRLGERAKQPAGTLSGGEQQMLALAHAYIGGAKTVLLDEVSMGLAPRIVDEIFELLGRLAETGMSLLVVEQYVKRALDLADYVYILNRGQVCFVGEPTEVGMHTAIGSYLGDIAS